jgi:phenylacetate-CoA ligase
MGLSPQQQTRLADLIVQVRESNSFYQGKWAATGVDSTSHFDRLPFTTKAELVDDQIAHPPYGSNLTGPILNYTRLHQSSGTTTGQPMRWLDTTAGWDWVVTCWQSTFDSIGISPTDRCFFPFSFGPFLGFWSAFEACLRRGCFVLSGGGFSSVARLRCIIDHGITAVFCTPTYALHLLELAKQNGINLEKSNVKTVVVAGEPGGNIASTKAMIEIGWGARLIDHYGMTEIGPVAYEHRDDPGFLTVIESDQIAEVIVPQGTQPVKVGDIGELVVTNLGRPGSPLIRYRTGDLVRESSTRSEQGWMRLDGGIIGRADDMLHVRGNNLYPSAIEAIVRSFTDVVEFRILVNRDEALTDIELEIEPEASCDHNRLLRDLTQRLKTTIGFRIQVKTVPPGQLPRFELKAKRIVFDGKKTV